jgi:hypothetical protein
MLERRYPPLADFLAADVRLLAARFLAGEAFFAVRLLRLLAPFAAGVLPCAACHAARISLGTRPRSDTLENPLARAQLRMSFGLPPAAAALDVRRRTAVRVRRPDVGRADARNGASTLSNSLVWMTQRSIRYC